MGPRRRGRPPKDFSRDGVADAFRRASTLGSGRIDVLVWAAGVVGRTNLLTHRVPPADFDRVMDVNAKGIFNGCRAALPYVLDQGYGRIVNIAGKEGNAGMLGYTAPKAAITPAPRRVAPFGIS